MDDLESLAGGHLDAGSISAYLDGRLGSGEKERVQKHLADCPECRREMSELVDLLKANEGRRRRWPLAATGIAAAAVAALVIGGSLMREAADGPGTVRTPEGAAERESVRSIAVISPSPEASVAREAVAFAWEPVGEGTTYRLTMTDGAGRTVWSTVTHESAVDMPEDLQLHPGEIYLWYVDAVLSDGTTATTGVTRLRLTP